MAFDRLSDSLLAWFADNVPESSMPKHVQATTDLDRQVAVESKWLVPTMGCISMLAVMTMPEVAETTIAPDDHAVAHALVAVAENAQRRSAYTWATPSVLLQRFV